MNIPGSDILDMALSVISSDEFQWFAFADRLTQPNGVWMAAYAPPLSLQGSVQPLPRNLYQQYGLDFSKHYYNFFVSQDIIDINRDISGDLLVFRGQTHQCLSITPWYGIDGWVEVLAVRILNTPLIVEFSPPPYGSYPTSSILTFAVIFNSPVVVTGIPYIALSAVMGVINGNALYISGSGGNVLTFQYTVVSGDVATGLIATPPLFGNISNLSGTMAANTAFIAPDMSGVNLNV